MNQDSDSDYEQVFIINDTDDCSSDQHKPFSGSSRDSSNNNYNVYPEDTKKFLSNATPLAAVALVGFLTIFFFLSFIGIAFDLSPQHIGMMAFFSIMGLIVITLLSIQGDESDIVIAEETVKAENRSSNRGKKKKFNNIQEYRVSQEFQRDKAELASKQTSEEKNSQEDKDNIDIAIRALVSLGFKIKRATDLVSRALDSGISPKETQVLVRYALSNNNKA
jgi:hypothetical protein